MRRVRRRFAHFAWLAAIAVPAATGCALLPGVSASQDVASTPLVSQLPRESPAAQPAASETPAAAPSVTLVPVVGSVCELHRDGGGGERIVAGAAVVLFDEPPPTGLRGIATAVPAPARRTTSGADGQFQFEVRPDEAWRVVVLPDDGPPHTAGAGTGAGDLGEVWLKSDWLYVTDVVVVDEGGAPVPNPEIRVFGGGNCDTAPAIVLTGDAEGRAKVHHRYGGFLVTAPDRALVWAGTGTEQRTETVTLPRGYDIRGVVVDDEGRPVAGADVSLENGNVGRRAQSDMGGEFRFERVEVGHSAGGWVVKDGARRSWSASAGDERVRIRLARPVVVEGTVVLADGSTVARAQVWAQGRFNNVGAATANERGEFRVVANACEGLRLYARSWRDVAGTTLLSEGLVALAAEPGAHVNGVRIPLTERPHSFVRVRATTTDGHPTEIAYVTMKPAGSGSQAPTDGSLLCLVDAPPGTEIVARVHARDPALARCDVRVVTALEPTCPAIDVRLDRVPPLRVRLTDATGAEIPASEWSEFAVRPPGAARIRDDRTVEVAPGSVFYVTAKARGLSLDREFVAPGGASREVTLRLSPLTQVRGQFLRRDGASAPGLLVAVHPTRWSDGNASAYATTAPDGSFVVEGAPAGDGAVVVYAGSAFVDPTVFVRRLHLDPTPAFDLGEVVIGNPLTVVGRVESPDGDSMAGAEAQVAWGDGFGGATGYCGPDGTFRVTAADVADALVTVRRPGRLCGVALVDFTKSAEFLVPMRRVGVLRLCVAFERPIDDVHLESPADPRLRWRPGSWGRSGDEPWTEIADVPEGTWTLVVTAKDRPEWRRTVTVHAGEVMLAPIEE